MFPIPGTTVKASFTQIPLETRDGQTKQAYPHLYDSHDSGTVMASLNAGNAPSLSVGGGGLNLAFSKALHAQKWNDYAARHIALATATDPDGTATQSFVDPDPCASMTLINKRVPGAKDYTGLAFLDAFDDALCPHGLGCNRAMLYVAPPDGRTYQNSSVFLQDVGSTATHAAEAVLAHNIWAASHGAPQITHLRMAMYSSNIYVMKGVPLDDVALTIFDGLVAGLGANPAPVTQIEMPVGNPGYEPLYAAVKARFAGN